jgi:hypothetical protein
MSNGLIASLVLAAITKADIPAIGGGHSATVDDDASNGTGYSSCRRSHHAGQ